MNPLNSPAGSLIAGLALSVIIVFATLGDHLVTVPANAVIIWAHVFAGIVWVGLLYYFSFVQVPALAEAASDEGGPGGEGITRYVAPRALAWFRWGAVFTWLTGAAYLGHNGQFASAFALGTLTDTVNTYAMTIGIGAWLGTFMLFNVWVLIWPNQKKIPGLVDASPEAIAQARRTAFLASRTNTMLSVPLLMSMVGAHHGFFM